MNSNKLRSVMILHGDTNKSLADFLGMTPQTFSAKINERPNKNGDPAEFTYGEMKKIRERYNLSSEEFESIFFG